MKLKNLENYQQNGGVRRARWDHCMPWIQLGKHLNNFEEKCGKFMTKKILDYILHRFIYFVCLYFIDKFTIVWNQQPIIETYFLRINRVPYIASTLDSSRDGKKRRILDIGCGGGFLSEGLAEHFHTLGWSDDAIEIVGLEPNSNLVQIARAHLPKHLEGKVTYLVDTIENYVTQNSNPNFDTVVMSEVIEHVDNPQEFLKYAISAAKVFIKIVINSIFFMMGWIFC